MRRSAWVYAALPVFVVTSWAAWQPRSTGTVAAPRSSVQELLRSESAPLQVQPPHRTTLQAAANDPFAGDAPPPPTVTVPPAAPPASVAPPAPIETAPPPSAPALDLQYTGRMSAPDGGLAVFAQLGNEPLLLRAGMELPNGYRIERITETAVELVYPPLNTTARLDLPPPPAFEVR